MKILQREDISGEDYSRSLKRKSADQIIRTRLRFESSAISLDILRSPEKKSFLYFELYPAMIGSLSRWAVDYGENYVNSVRQELSQFGVKIDDLPHSLHPSESHEVIEVYIPRDAEVQLDYYWDELVETFGKNCISDSAWTPSSEDGNSEKTNLFELLCGDPDIAQSINSSLESILIGDCLNDTALISREPTIRRAIGRSIGLGPEYGELEIRDAHVIRAAIAQSLSWPTFMATALNALNYVHPISLRKICLDKTYSSRTLGRTLNYRECISSLVAQLQSNYPIVNLELA